MTRELAPDDCIDTEVMFAEPLTSEMLNVLAATLLRHAPGWTTLVRRSVSEGHAGIAVDLSSPGALYAAIEHERERLGAAGVAAPSVTTWFEGSTPEYQLQLEVSAQTTKRRGAALANNLTLVIERHEVEGRPVADWLREFIRATARDLPVAYGFARTFGEFASMNKNPPTSRGVPEGLDLSRYLPGLYWLNCFGEPYVRLIGLERLMATPARTVEPAGGGVLITLDDSPWSWQTTEYARRRTACVQHLGEDLFFDRSARERPTRIPTLFTEFPRPAPRPRPN